MAIKNYAKINTQDYDLSRVQDAVTNFANQFTQNPTLDGILLEGISLISAQDNLVETGLGRPWRAWFLGRLSTNAQVYEGAQTNMNKFLNLQCTANCTVSIWVV
jgi:hypothetical protein